MTGEHRLPALLLFGESLLEVGVASLDLPAIGAVKVSSALVFDVGVYLVVIGLVMALLRSLGSEEVST